MMHRTQRLSIDSFKAARGELEPLFSRFRSDERLRNDVRLYLLPSLSHRRHRHVSDRGSRAHERSLFRTNVSLVLQEARRRADHRVAAIALDVALTEARPAHLAQELDPAWVKDAVAACQSVEALRQMEAVLRHHEQQLLASGTAAGTDGFLLTAAFGRSPAAVTERGLRLGDEDADDGGDGVSTPLVVGEEAAQGGEGALVPRDGGAGGGEAQRTKGVGELQPQQVAAALAQPASLTELATRGDGVDESLWASAEAKAAAGLRRLQRQHRDITAGPNVSFTRYFLHQGLVRNEVELMALYQAMRARPHDVAFRVVGGSRAESGTENEGGGERFNTPYASAVHALVRQRRGLHRVPWLPAAMGAYTLDTRESVPQDTVLSNRHLLRSLARERLVVYQSLSSMLPVLFLNPQPGEAVLDLCASPGNKTGLILDVMHGAPSGSTGTAVPGASGCVVANEAQTSRLRDLRERLRDASPEVAVTRGRGQAFGAGSATGSAQSESASAFLGDEGLYDAVLVDAPCSGEGRMGRDALTWRLWHPGRGLEFFPTQCALLQRAVQLCRTGGRIVYATCTLNPLENEAVVAAVLRACGGAVQLVPPPQLHSRHRVSAAGGEEGEGEVPVLRLSPGLHRWDVPSSAGGFLRTAAEAYAQGESERRLLPDMFASHGGAADGDGSDDVGATLHRCCRRVMPHLNGNTDGFFVAVLRKTASVRPALRDAAAAAAGGTPVVSGAAAAQLTGGSFGSASRAAASSLAFSLAGGRTLLNDRGLLRLQATNPTVQRLLGPFFGESASPAPPSSSSRAAAAVSHCGCSTVQSFLDRHGWTAVWKEGEGLRLLSTTATQLLQRHASTSREDTQRGGQASEGGSTELLEAGVVVVDEHGVLTERGASLLYGSATRRVLPLPLPYAQLLLANRTLEVGGSLRLMPAFMQEAERALSHEKGLLRSISSGGADDAAATPPWCLAVLRTLGDGTPGNAMVCIDVAAPTPATAWAAPLAQWVWPVRVEVLRGWTTAAGPAAGLVRLHLTLPPSSRHRTSALIGRLQVHAHRLRDPTARQREQLQASASLSPSLVMGANELQGAPVQASQQHRQLLHGGGERRVGRATAAVASGSGAGASSSASTVFEL